MCTDHQDFKQLSSGDSLRMKLYLPHSSVSITYRPKSDSQARVIVDRGVLVTPMDPLLEGRVNLEGSELIVKKVQVSDSGAFKVMDLAGFPVATVYIDVARKTHRGLLHDELHEQISPDLCFQTQRTWSIRINTV